jgi:chemotaxis protein MotB
MRYAIGFRFAASVPLVLGMLVTGCGGYKSKYATASADLTAANAKTKALQDSLTAANARTAELEQKTASMQSSVDQLNAELEKQKAATTEATSAYEGMVKQLQGELSSGQVTIQQMRDGIRVNLAQDVLFKSGSADLDKTGQELLAKVAEELKQNKYEVIVIGHTDNQKIGGKLAAKYPSNWALGGARAGSIVNVLQTAGIEPTRLLTVSASEFRPRADNATPEGRAQNRRIEIRLRPVEVEGDTTKAGQ